MTRQVIALFNLKEASNLYVIKTINITVFKFKYISNIYYIKNLL